MTTISYYIWPGQVYFGFGASQRIGTEAQAEGAKHVFVITDPGVVAAGLLESITRSLTVAGMAHTIYDQVIPNPDTNSVDAAAAAFRESQADLIVGVGGGSSLDTAKAARMVAGGPAEGRVAEYAYRMGDQARPHPRSLPP